MEGGRDEGSRDGWMKEWKGRESEREREGGTE